MTLPPAKPKASPSPEAASAAALGLNAPPTGDFPKPPVRTAVQTLPFGELTWENFERLCSRLAGCQAQIESAERYGRQGQAQDGIDIFARKRNGRYDVWQVKRYKSFRASDVRKAAKAFLAAKWVGVTDTLHLAVQATLEDAKVQDEIETQRRALASEGVQFVALGGDLLLEAVRPHQDLVLSFFGRAWVNALYGTDAEAAVVDRLDGPEVAKIRAQLSALYRTRFNALDPGVVTPALSPTGADTQPLGLLERYAMADVLIRERKGESPSRAPTPTAPQRDPAYDTTQWVNGAPLKLDQAEGGLRDEERRVPAHEWLATGDQVAVVADAGAGKSTLLRCIALDLLGDQSTFPELGARWGERLPLLVSFARWARATEMAGGEVGLKALIDATLQPLLTANLTALVNRAVDEQRIVLLVDGLDEWSAEQAARTAYHTLIAYVGAHGLPVIVTGRPNGLRKIGTLPQTWKRAELAPLSSAQQRALALLWFQHAHAVPDGASAAADAAAVWDADRFLKELNADAALGELAATPLLLMGLLTLAMRQVALPSNLVQALQSLMQILLEVHPERRATAAGEVRQRFSPDVSSETRQGAIAALAFASRQEGRDGGYDRQAARVEVLDHLTKVKGLSLERAEAVATDILAVNSETVGLLIEKAPGEIGFSHASLEEFLSAVHVQSWPFNKLLAFAAAKAGEPRWRHVIRNLVALNTRQSEVDAIVQALEQAPLDVIGALNRQALLADIVFSRCAMHAATAQRLASATLAAIDAPTYERARSALARTALNGLGLDPVAATLDAHVRRWAPRRLAHTDSLVTALERWTPDEALMDTLIGCFSSEDGSSRRTASRILGTAFKGDAAAKVRLQTLIDGAHDLRVCTAAIEALVLGWPDKAHDALIAACAASRSPTFQALALWTKVQLGLHTADDLSSCLQFASEGSALDYLEKSPANETLFQGWPDHPQVVDLALESLAQDRRRHLPSDTATAYLTRCAPSTPKVADWVLAQLGEKFPFIGLWSRDWSFIPKFAAADARIRETVVAAIAGGAREHFGREVRHAVAEIKDERLRDYAISQVRTQSGPSRFWPLWSLVEGWSEDPLVQALFQELLALDDANLDMVVALLPKLYNDREQARTRLLRVTRTQPQARFDLLVNGFNRLGCYAEDDEVVQALLAARPEQAGPLDDHDMLFLAFGGHPEVRALAAKQLGLARPPYYALAIAYPEDPEIKAMARQVLTPSSPSIRYVVATAAGLNADRAQSLDTVLCDYRLEVDFDLKIQLTIYNAEFRLALGEAEALAEELLFEADQPGIDHDDLRSASFAGLIVLGQAARFNETRAPERPIRLGSFLNREPSSAFCRLIVAHWTVLKETFGEDLATKRLTGADTVIWPVLAPFVGAHPAARADFLAWCAATDQLGVTAMSALADLDPRSDLLRRQVTKVIFSWTYRNEDSLALVMTAAEIARDQFLEPELVEQAAQQYLRTREVHDVVILAILDKAHPTLQSRVRRAIDLGVEDHFWAGAGVIGALLEPAAEVVSLILALAERDAHPGREHQHLPNQALIQRLEGDPELAEGLQRRLSAGISNDALAYAAALLAASGRLDDATRALCAAKLEAEYALNALPSVVFDAMADQYRPLSHVLIDILTASSSL